MVKIATFQLHARLLEFVLSCYGFLKLLLKHLWNKSGTIINFEKLAFLEHYKGFYGYPDGAVTIDHLRGSEFSRLNGVAYLDHAGATLYSDTQIQASLRSYTSEIYGNPHSQNQSSSRTSDITESARLQVLAFFNAAPSDYICVFTSGATAGLKLIGETFPWTSDSEFHYTTENHNSVLGVREYALDKGATVTSFDIKGLVFRQRTHLKRDPHTPTRRKDGYNLFAMPTECNFSGSKLDLGVVKLIQGGKHVKNARGRWTVLLDAAKSSSTSPLDLSRTPADFVVTSFYKIFGYPTGLGALIMRRDAANILQKKYFGGGTVAVSIADTDFYRKREKLEQWLEDGTASFLAIAALSHGFAAINRLGISNIARHTWSLTHYTASKMLELTHGNGNPVCCVYGTHRLSHSEGFQLGFQMQGPVITFNLKRADGSWVGYREVEKLAALSGIHLRTGCFCNPGACAKYLKLSSEDMASNYEAGHTCWDDHDLMNGKPTGAVRISFGYMSTFEDCQKFLRFIHKFFVEDDACSLKQGKREVKRSSMRLTSIYIYPIKSCAGFEAQSWPVTRSGLLYDREWAIVDAGNVPLTQKRVPFLCVIKPVIDLTSKKLKISSPNMEETLEIPLEKEELDQSDTGLPPSETSEWLTKALGVQCSLIRKDTESVHVCKWRKTDDNGGSTEARSFANEGQFLLISNSSLRDLRSRVTMSGSKKLRLDAMQFRPNLVVSGGIPYEEDNWRSIKIGDTELSVIGGCNRCQMITIDQRTGKMDACSEPLATLASYRRTKGKVLFGTLLGVPTLGHLNTSFVVGNPIYTNA